MSQFYSSEVSDPIGVEPQIQIRNRCNTWPRRTELEEIPRQKTALTATRRTNPWGNYSYADLITQAIQSSINGRMALADIYQWMIKNVAYFADKAGSQASNGWKNSIRHNLSLHQRFIRVTNDSGCGKSSWWTLDLKNGGVKNSSSARRRAMSMDNVIHRRRHNDNMTGSLKRNRNNKKSDLFLQERFPDYHSEINPPFYLYYADQQNHLESINFRPRSFSANNVRPSSPVTDQRFRMRSQSNASCYVPGVDLIVQSSEAVLEMEDSLSDIRLNDVVSLDFDPNEYLKDCFETDRLTIEQREEQLESHKDTFATNSSEGLNDKFDLPANSVSADAAEQAATLQLASDSYEPSMIYPTMINSYSLNNFLSCYPLQDPQYQNPKQDVIDNAFPTTNNIIDPSQNNVDEIKRILLGNNDGIKAQMVKPSVGDYRRQPSQRCNERHNYEVNDVDEVGRSLVPTFGGPNLMKPYINNNNNISSQLTNYYYYTSYGDENHSISSGASFVGQTGQMSPPMATLHESFMEEQQSTTFRREAQCFIANKQAARNM